MKMLKNHFFHGSWVEVTYRRQNNNNIWYFLGVSNSDALSAASSETKLSEVILRDAYKEENSIVIKWETETSQILGFRVVYRLFGKPEFKQGPPLAPSEREFRIKNVPLNVSFEIKKLTNTISINWSLIKLALKRHS